MEKETIIATLNADLTKRPEAVIEQHNDDLFFYVTFLDENEDVIGVTYSDAPAQDFIFAGPFMTQREAETFVRIMLDHGQVSVRCGHLCMDVLQYWAFYRDRGISYSRPFDTVEEARAEADRLQHHFRGRTIGLADEPKTMAEMAIEQPHLVLYKFQWKDNQPHFPQAIQ